jgi:hypothetical protein
MDKGVQIVKHQRQTKPIISNLYNIVLYDIPQQKQETCFVLCRQHTTILMLITVHATSKALHFFTSTLVKTCFSP